MVASDDLLEQIAAQAAQLPLSKRLRLIRRIVDTLSIPPEQEQPQHLIYGQCCGARMSTEEDFRLAEWRPTAQELNGP